MLAIVQLKNSCIFATAIQKCTTQCKARSVRLSVRTPGFHPGKGGSIPPRTTKNKIQFRLKIRNIGPFVYRLGRQVFILVRGVRFPHGLQVNLENRMLN